MFGVFRNFKSSAMLFQHVTKKYWVILALLFSLALFVRWGVVPHRHYVFYDEYEHINIAKNMAESRQFARCDLYLDGQCLSSNLPQWTPGYHFLLSLVFNVSGSSESVAYNFNVFLGALSVVVLFLIAYLITQRESVALLSAGLLAFTPLHLKFSGNSSLEMASSLFILLNVLSFLIFSQRKDDRSFVQFMAVTAFTLLLRPENGLILLLFAAGLVFFAKIDRRYYFKMLDYAILLLPYFLYIVSIKAYETLWMQGWQMSIAHVFMSHLWFWVKNEAIPIVWVFMAAVGAHETLKKNKPMFWCLFLFFASFLCFYSFMHRGMTGHFQRMNLQFYFPVVIWSAMGFYGIYQRGVFCFKSRRLVFSVLAFAAALSFFWSFPYVFIGLSPHIFDEQQEMFLEGENFDERYVFISYNPSSIITTMDKSSAFIGHMMDDNAYNSFLKDRPLVLVDDYWCVQNRNDFCSTLKNRYVLEDVRGGSSAGKGMFYLIKKK